MKHIFFTLILFITIPIALSGKNGIVKLDTETEELIYLRKILEGPEKNIYSYDSHDAFIKVFAPDGEFLRKMAGEGEGPGQIKRGDGADFGFTPGYRQIWFTEYYRGHQWMTFIDLKGNLKKTLTYKLQGSYGIIGAHFHNNNTIFLRVDRTGKTERESNIFYSYYRSEIITIDLKGVQKSLILSREYPERISFIRDGGDMGIPFKPEFYWGVTKKGDILFTDGTGNKIDVYGPEGKHKREIQIPVGEPEVVTKKDLEKWRTDLKKLFVGNKINWYKRFGKVIEKYTKSIFKFKPVILGFRITPGGNLLLKCRTKLDDIFRYILVGMSGKKISGTESGLGRILITQNYIIMVGITDDEEREITLFKRSGTEKEDLEKAFKITR